MPLEPKTGNSSQQVLVFLNWMEWLRCKYLLVVGTGNRDSHFDPQKPTFKAK